MPAIDPSGFQISVIVSTPDGARIPLWLAGKSTGGEGGLGGLVDAVAGGLGGAIPGGLGGAVGGDSGGRDLVGMDLPIVESAEVELSQGLIGKVTIQCAAPFDLGIKLIESALFRVGNKIEVQFSYPRLGRSTPWILAVADKPSIRMSGDEGLMVTINANGLGISSLRSGPVGGVFTATTYRDIIQEIADRHSWAVDFGGDVDLEFFVKLGLAKAVGAVLPVQNPLDVTRESTSQGNLSDWFFIIGMCRTSGYECFLGPNKRSGKTTLYVQDRKDLFEGAPRFKLLLRGKPDFDTSFPMLTFDSEAEGLWLPGAALGVQTQDITMEKKTVECRVDASTTKENALGDTGVPTDEEVTVDGDKIRLADLKSGRTGEFLHVSARDPRGPDQVAQAHRDDSAIRGGFNINTTTYAIPEVLPGEIFQVEGAGVFNSNYVVDVLTWSANASEWIMRLTMRNNASAGGFIDPVFLRPAPQSNTEEVDAGLPGAGGGPGGLLEKAADVAGI